MSNSNQRINILYLIDVLENVGGAEYHLLELVKRLDKTKYRPMVCCIAQKGPFAIRMEKEGIPVKALFIKKIYDFYGIRQALYLIRFLRKEKVKIIQTFDFGSDVLGPIVAKLAGVPVIISSRRDMGFLREKYHILALRLIDILVDKIIVVSKAVEKSLTKREKIKGNKVITIYNGVDLVKFSRDSIDVDKQKQLLGLELSRPIVGTIGRLRVEKGHKYFLELARLVLNAVPKVQFLIVGDGPLKNRLKLRAKDLNLQDNVIFAGERVNIPEILSVIDVFVLPSLTEGFSNVLLEAMAMEIPVVATNVGGNPEAIINGKTGFLSARYDYHQMTKLVIKLLLNKNLAKKIGTLERKYVEDNLDIDRMIKNIEGLYQSLIRKKDDTLLGNLKLEVKQCNLEYVNSESKFF